MKNKLILTLLVLLLTACMAPGSNDLSDIPPSAEPVVPVCDVEPIEVPEMPKEIPGYLRIDDATGLHMTGKPQEIDFSTYRLTISGLVEKPLSLRYDDLRCLPKVTDDPPLVCRGFFEDHAAWSGVPIAEILKLARPLPQAESIAIVSADGYRLDVDMQAAMHPENFLAYELEEETLPVLHGFPLRAVFPAEEGTYWVKWIVAIEVN